MADTDSIQNLSFKGNRVLVTGADGFIGSHLTEALLRAGANVRAMCVYNSQGSWGWLEDSPKELLGNLEVVLGDIRDARFVEESCKRIDTVFHLAALIAIPYSYIAPHSFIDTNVMGTLNILEGVRKAGCKRLIQTSTSEVYGTPATLPICETHPLQGQSPYSASKIGADKLCESYYCSFGVPVVTLRPFNTYGPRQSLRAVLPTILIQMLGGKSEICLGSLSPRRDLTFVLDTVDGFMRAALVPGIEGQTIQLGTGYAVSIGELFELCRTSCSSNAKPVCEAERIRPDKSEVMVLQSDPSLASSVLDWKARTSLQEGLNQTRDWVAANVHRFPRLGYQR